MDGVEELKGIINNSRSAVFFGGAGVSTESGLPDFRSEKSRAETLTRFGLEPEILLSASFFKQAPDVFYRYLHEALINPQVQPNDAHKALAKWEREGHLVGVATQNIDGLHQVAGSKNVWELHGSVGTYFCVQCGKSATVDQVLAQLDAGEPVPLCECGGLLKPSVVLYGEALPEEAFSRAAQAVADADTLIIGGTSLAVQPAASLIGAFRGENLVVVNQERTFADSSANLVIHAPIAQVFGEASR